MPLFWIAIILGILSVLGTLPPRPLPQDNIQTSASDNFTQILSPPLPRQQEEHAVSVSKLEQRNLRERVVRARCQLRLIIPLIPKTGGRDMRVKFKEITKQSADCSGYVCSVPEYCFPIHSGIMFVHIQPSDEPFRSAIWKNSFQYNFSVVTFVRDPVERLISEYYFLKAGGFMNFTNLLEERGWHSLEEYARAPVNRNYMCGFLLGHNMWSKMITDSDYHTLLQNIKKGFERDLLFLGVLDEYVMSWRLLNKRVGAPARIRDTQKINVNRNKPSSIDSGLRRKIKEWNHLDVKLYEFALAHLRNLSRTEDYSFFSRHQRAGDAVGNEEGQSLLSKVQKLEKDLGISNPLEGLANRLQMLEKVYYGNGDYRQGSITKRVDRLWTFMYQ